MTLSGEACERLQQIVDTYNLEDSTEVIIKVNIAIFYGISDDSSRSLKILNELYDKMQTIENLEFYYRYLVEVNFRVVQYLAGNRDSLSKLLELQKESASRGEEYLEAHVKSLMKISEYKEAVDLSWYKTPLANSQMEHLSCWKYYGRKYLFGELEFWSES